MTEQRAEFDIAGRPALDVTASSGDVLVTEGPPGVIRILVSGNGADRFTIEERGGVVSVGVDRSGRGAARRGSADVTAEVPPGTDVDLRASSGDLTTRVRIGSGRFHVASGDVRVTDSEGDLEITSASGDLHLGTVGGRLKARVASGDVRADSIGSDCSVMSASGDVFVDLVAGRVDIKTASGDATFRRVDGSEVRARTGSGTVRIGIPPRRTVEVDVNSLSGSLKTNLTERDSGESELTLAISVTTLSGNVYLNDA